MANLQAHHFTDSAIAPSQHCFEIVPHDTDLLPAVTKGLYVGTGGDIAVRTLRSDVDVIFRNVPSGYILDIRLSAVRSTGTTAADMIGLA